MDLSLSDSDIRKCLNNDVNIVLYSEIADMRTIDEIFDGHKCAVILYQSRLNYGHWTCLIRNNEKKKIYYFDSYGKILDHHLKALSEKQKKICNETENYLAQLILKSGYAVDYNSKQLQADDPNVTTCGRWVISRCLFDSLTNAEFAELFEQKKGETYSPDDIVLDFTKRLIGK